ncbi:MAG: hypothetical protein U1A77_15390 [Pirellulales bacterium]
MDGCRAVGFLLLAPLILLGGCSSGFGGYMAASSSPPRATSARSSAVAPVAVASHSSAIPVTSGAARYLQVDEGEAIRR